MIMKRGEILVIKDDVELKIFDIRKGWKKYFLIRPIVRKIKTFNHVVKAVLSGY